MPPSAARGACAPTTSGRAPAAAPQRARRPSARRGATAAARPSLPDRAGRPAPPTAVAPPPSFPSPTPSPTSGGRGGGGEGVDDPSRVVGVLLLNLGGPETLDDVQPFLYNLFSDDSIIRLPPPVRFLQRPLAAVISTLRAPKSAEGYRAIGGGSPLLRITRDQAAALRAALADRGVAAQVYVGMRYWKPFTEDAVAALLADGVTDLIVLPLYPQFSISTSGSSLRLLEAMMDADLALAGLRHAVVSSWYWRPGYQESVAALISTELNKFPDPSSVDIFFSAHGVPVSYVRDGDPYQAEMEDCVALIMARVARRGHGNRHTLAYQSRVGPVEWLTPYTDDKIRELGAGGVKSLLAVPISFVSEHIETLEEIDVEYRDLALASGVEHWRRVPALNTDPAFIGDLADLVVEKLPACAPRPGWRPQATEGEDASLGPPVATVQALLKTYDRERRPLPPPRTEFAPGWNTSAELWNGRIAMVAILVVILLEVVTGEGVVAGLFRLD